jgi:hypothetical protein
LTQAVTPKRRLGRIAAGFNRKARQYHVRGVITAEMLAQKGDTCAYCPTVMSIMDGTWDHVIPFDKGGTNEPTNIVRCCMDCQRRKFTKTPDQFAEHQSMEAVCGICGKKWKPRYAEAKRGMARYCSLSCAAKARWK